MPERIKGCGKNEFVRRIKDFKLKTLACLLHNVCCHEHMNPAHFVVGTSKAPSEHITDYLPLYLSLAMNASLWSRNQSRRMPVCWLYSYVCTLPNEQKTP